MKKNKKIDINSIDEKTLIINLYLTQMISIIFTIALILIFMQKSPLEILLTLIPDNIVYDIVIATIFSLIIVASDVILTKLLPKEKLDDGGINEKLFHNLPIWHIAIIAIIVGFTEELLFRGVLQSLLGVVFANIIFTLIHFRYLNKTILIVHTFVTGMGLGLLAYYTEWFTAFFAHVLIDFILGVLTRKKLLVY